MSSASPTTDAAAASTHSWASALRLVAADIKIAHSVFALPFALLAAFMAARPGGESITRTRFGGQLVLVVLAVVFARTCAMLANRLLDRSIDADNPRTRNRAIPSGQLPATRAVAFFAFSACAFALVCLAFGVFFDNWWPGLLGIPVLAWISAYGLLKRFSALCHIYLGSSLAISPLAAALAVSPEALTTQPALYLLSGMVLCWVAGFDIIYALQDVESDVRQGLHSVPSRLGVGNALQVSRVLHVAAVGCLIGCWWVDERFAALFLAGITVVAGLLLYEHATVKAWGTTRMALTFFTLNGVISCLLGVLGIADIIA